MIFDRAATRALRAVALVAVIAFAPAVAEAQTTTPTTTNHTVDASPKGTVGLGLIGAEIGLAVPTLFGLHKPWSLIVFPAVGAAAGAVGGYFAFDRPNHAELAVGTLVLGIALIIPTAIITVSHTRFTEDDLADTAPPATDEGAPPGAPGVEGTGTDGQAPTPAPSSTPPTTRRDIRPLPGFAGAGALRVSGGRLMVGVPGFAVLPHVTPLESQRYGDRAVPTFHLSLFSGSF